MTNATPHASAAPSGNPAEAVSTLHVDSLRKSPTNPRKTFSDAALAELADSIRSQGLLQPIVVRPVVDQDIRHTHEVVFGHRRLRAAQLAGLGNIPAIVRAMTDAQAAAAQLHENLAREDVTALEEGEGFRALMREHGITVAQLMQDTGKSRSYIYGRIKLATVHPTVRQAVADGLIDAEVGTLIARVPQPLQPRALDRCTYTDHSQQPPLRLSMSYRACKDALQNDFTEPLADATWPLDDATLNPTAGPCSSCPHNSATDPDLADTLGANVCTQPKCFAGKLQARDDAQLSAARADNRVYGAAHGSHVVLMAEFVVNDAATDGTWHRVRLADAMAKLAAAGQPVPDVCYLERGAGTVPCLRNNQAEDVATRTRTLLGIAPVPKPTPKAAAEPTGGEGQADGVAQDDTGEHPEESADGLTPVEAVLADRTAWLRVRRAVLAEIIQRPRTAQELRLVLHREYNMADGLGLVEDALGITTALKQAADQCDADGTDYNPGATFRQWIDTASPDTLAAALVGIAVDDLLGTGGTSPWSVRHNPDDTGRRIALAQAYGVSVVEAGTGAAGGAEPADGVA